MEEKKGPATVKDYINLFPPEVQKILKSYQKNIKSYLPEATEKISWAMPTYWQKKNIIHFAAHKNHIGIYPGPEAIVHFKDKIKEYHTTKGAIQIPFDQEIPWALIKEIALYNLSTVEQA